MKDLDLVAEQNDVKLEVEKRSMCQEKIRTCLFRVYFDSSCLLLVYFLFSHYTKLSY